MIKKIQEKYLKYGFKSGSGLYIKRPYVLQFIEECNKYNILILGIEGFSYTENKYITPEMNMIADFSKTYNEYLKKDWISLREFCRNSSNKFINLCFSENNSNELVFNFVLRDQEQYNQDKSKLES